jgi:HK97 family phage major capsid protein
MERFKKQREEFTRLQNEALGIIQAAAEGERDLTAEEKTENEKRFSRMQQIGDLVAEDTKFASLALQAAAVGAATPAIQLPTDAPGREEFAASKPGANLFAALPGEDPEKHRFRIHRAAVNEFIRTGVEPAGLKFTLTTGSGSGVLLPTTIGVPIVLKRQRNVIRAARIARNLTTIITAGMEAITVPVFDDTANTADVIAQDNTSENNKDPSLTSIPLGADLYDSGTVWSSNTLLNSVGFDLLAYLEPMLQARIEDAELTAWATNLADNATVGKTTASTTGITYAELLDWQHSIPARYRGDGVFLVSDGLLRVLRGLVDAENRPLFQVSIRDDAPDTLLGWPLFVADDLDAPAAGAVSGIAASAEGLVIREVSNKRIARYANIPTHPDQFGIRMFSNGDFAFVTSKVRALKHAAS